VGGTSWEQVLNAQEFLGTSEKVYIRWLTVAPSDADYVYALASIKYYDQGILLKSVDGGDTWTRSDSTVDGKSVCLAVDPHDPLRLYVGSWYSGMYRSKDGGSTWQAINNGLPTIWAVFRSVAIDPTDTQRVYTGVGGKVYQSTNGGDSWDQIGDTLPPDSDAYRIAIDPSNSNNIYAAVWGEGVYKLVGWAPHLVVPPNVAVLLEPTAPDQTVRDLSIRNDGGGTLNWSVSSPTKSWLVAQKEGDVLHLTLDKSEITLVGGYFLDTDVLTITDDGADNSPQNVNVIFYVGPVSYIYAPVVLGNAS
jgi:photosystem II stability/assembly factor-like uncharacterized protein